MTQRGIRKPKSETPPDLRSHPAVRNYMLFCMATLFLLVVCLSERGLEWWALVPALVGCLALVTHWVHGPPLVLLSVAVLMSIPGPPARGSYQGPSQFQTPTLMDLVLCIAVLAYVLGHYRLLALVRNVFPPDPRRLPGDPSRRRSADLVTGGELVFLGLALPLWTGLAVLVWVWMMEEETSLYLSLQLWRVLHDRGQGVVSNDPLNMSRQLWSFLRLVWAGLAVLAAAGVTASYLRQTSATPEESLLYLQDQCWRQTRREQSSLNRWLIWARLRAQRKKESS